MLTLVASLAVFISIFLAWMEIIFVPIQGINLIGGTFATFESSIAILMLIFISISGIYSQMSKTFRSKKNWIVDAVLGSAVLAVCVYLRYTFSVSGAGPNLCIAGGVLFLAESMRKMARGKVAKT